MNRPIRHEVVELLMSAAAHSDLSSWPWRRLVDEDGHLFTAAEAALANTATVTEAVTAHRLAIESARFYARKRADLTRVRDLLAKVPGVDEMDFATAASCLPPDQQAEVLALLSRYPEDFASG